MSNIVSLTEEIIQNTIPLSELCLLLNKKRGVVVKILEYLNINYTYIKQTSKVCRVDKSQISKIEDFIKENPNTRSFFTKKTCLEKYGVENPAQSIDVKSKIKKTNIEKYGVENPFQNVDIKKKIKQSNIEKYGVESYTQTDNYKEKTKQTCLEKYGVEYTLQSQGIREKSKKTCLDKYGTEYATQSNEIKEKTKQTCLDRYGVEYVLQSEGIIRKIKETTLEKYGVESFSQTDIYKERYKDTCLEKYGVENPSQSEEIKKKKNITCIERYGTDYAIQSPIVRNKCKESFIKKYGVENPFLNEEIKEKIKQDCLNKYGETNYFKIPYIQEKCRQTCLERYGAPYPLQNQSIRKKVLGYKDKTSPEKKIEEFLKNRGIDYLYEYECNNKNFDFAIFKDGELSILLEVDGEYFHGILSDYDNKHVHGEKDCERFEKVPDGVKLVVCDSKNVEKCFDEILRVFKINYEDWIQGIISSLSKDFPYPEYSEQRLKKDYNKLCNYKDLNKKGRLADSTIRQFHRSIWSSHLNNLPSPLEAWNDRNLLEKCVRNRFIYSSSLSSQSIANGFNVCKIAPKVSVFSASLAKYLIDKYLGDYKVIFDPFSGFSGRLLGTCALNKKYIGQDINLTHVTESNEIIQFHKLDATVIQKDILDSSGEYECLFTCPPYDSKELWGTENVFKSCDEWIDECLKRFKCKNYLFVVDDTYKYKDYIVETLDNSSHFGNNKEYVVLIKS